ncbi:sugar transferase, partial [Patescibacteria group bacterium]|nr:sugar transferase [Patescibacteria group bacterium]
MATKAKKALLFLGDLLILYLALFLMLYFSYGNSWTNSWNQHFFPFTIIYLAWLMVFFIIGLYELNLARNNLGFFITLGKALLINAVIAIAFFYFIPYFGIAPKTNLFADLIIFALLFIVWRQVYNYFIKTSPLLNNVLVLGQNQETKELINYIHNNPQMGYHIKKTVDPEEVRILSDLIKILVKDKVQTIVTTVNPHQDTNLVKNLYQCLPLKIIVTDLPAFYEKITGKIPVSSIEEIWFLENLMCGRKSIFEAAKRGTDVILSLFGLFITFLLFPLVASAIKLDSPGPVLYRQKRVGRDNQIFDIVKFRTMVIDAEKNGAQWSQKEDKRVTRVGKFLRKTRLDELPQLWNVLKNDMAFVGPRPERPEFAFSNELLAKIPFYQIR